MTQLVAYSLCDKLPKSWILALFRTGCHPYKTQLRRIYDREGVSGKRRVVKTVPSFNVLLVMTEIISKHLPLRGF